MAYYASAKGSVPFHKREEERKWSKHLRDHKRKIAESQSQVRDEWAGKRAAEHLHLRTKLKKMQTMSDRYAVIDYENRNLLERIIRMRQRGAVDTWNSEYQERDERKRTLSGENEETSKESEKETDLTRLSSAKQIRKIGYRTTGVRNYSANVPNVQNIIRSVHANEDEKMDKERAIIRAKIDHGQNERISKTPRETIGEHVTYFLKMFDENPLGEEQTETRRMRDENVSGLRKANRLLARHQNIRVDEVYYSNKLLDAQIEVVAQGIERSIQLEMGDEEDEEESIALGERVNEMKEAQKTLREGNEKQTDKADRKLENMRLHKKLKAIERGKGRKPPGDYDPNNKWWVTSPRARERKQFDEEARLKAEKRFKKEEERRIAREEENERIKKEKEKERLARKEQVPEGYHKKLRKTKKKPGAAIPTTPKETKKKSQHAKSPVKNLRLKPKVDSGDEESDGASSPEIHSDDSHGVSTSAQQRTYNPTFDDDDGDDFVGDEDAVLYTYEPDGDEPADDKKGDDGENEDRNDEIEESPDRNVSKNNNDDEDELSNKEVEEQSDPRDVKDDTDKEESDLGEAVVVESDRDNEKKEQLDKELSDDTENMKREDGDQGNHEQLSAGVAGEVEDYDEFFEDNPAEDKERSNDDYKNNTVDSNSEEDNTNKREEKEAVTVQEDDKTGDEVFTSDHENNLHEETNSTNPESDEEVENLEADEDKTLVGDSEAVTVLENEEIDETKPFVNDEEGAPVLESEEEEIKPIVLEQENVKVPENYESDETNSIDGNTETVPKPEAEEDEIKQIIREEENIQVPSSDETGDTTERVVGDTEYKESDEDVQPIVDGENAETASSSDEPDQTKPIEAEFGPKSEEDEIIPLVMEEENIQEPSSDEADETQSVVEDDDDKPLGNNASDETNPIIDDTGDVTTAANDEAEQTQTNNGGEEPIPASTEEAETDTSLSDEKIAETANSAASEAAIEDNVAEKTDEDSI